MSNTVLIEGDLKYGPSSSDYVHDKIVRMSLSCDWVQESTYTVGSGAAETLNLDSDFSKIKFLIVENLSAANAMTLKWTDRQTALEGSQAIMVAGSTLGGSSVCVNDPDPDADITLQGVVGNSVARVIVGGDL